MITGIVGKNVNDCFVPVRRLNFLQKSDRALRVDREAFNKLEVETFKIYDAMNIDPFAPRRAF